MSYALIPDADADSLPTPPPVPEATPRPIAHWSHTLALVFILVIFAFFGHARSTSTAIDATPKIMRYGTSILLEWLLLGSVIAGIYHRRTFFLAAFRSRENSNGTVAALGLLVYFLGFGAVIIVGGLLYFTPLFHKHNEAVVLAMLPHTPLDFLMWFGVSLTAGICEEITFRGYLLQQLNAWTRRPILSIIIAGLLFGSVHLYEGLGAILPLAALAIVYGLVVRHFKGDLRAVVIAHTLQDFVVAFIALAQPFIERHAPKH